MRKTLRTVAFVAALALTGRGGAGSAPPPPAPLAASDWKTMPADQKYAPGTLERLKAGDPALQTPEGWDAFQKTVVARQKDFPNKR